MMGRDESIMLLSNSQDNYAEESAHYARFFFLNEMPFSHNYKHV